MKSCSVRVVWCWLLKMTTFAITHNIALFLLVGHILNCGRSAHSSGIRDGNVRSINAIQVFVYCHILRPSPHSVNLCCSVSAIVHLWQEVDGVIFIRYSGAFVGIISCSTWYHIHLALSETGASFKFFHIRVQSVLGHSFCISISGDPAATHMLVFDPRTVQPVTSRYTDWAILAHHVAVCSLCNSLYPADQAATVVEPKVTESIKSGVYGFGNTKNRQQPFIRPSGFSHTDKHGCEGNTYTA